MNTKRLTGFTRGEWQFHKGRIFVVIGDREHMIARCRSGVADTRMLAAGPELFLEVKRLRNRNDFLEEIVALLQEQGVDIEQEGFPRWE